MINHDKKRHFTADDLLRRQEEPAKKRVKHRQAKELESVDGNQTTDSGTSSDQSNGGDTEEDEFVEGSSSDSGLWRNEEVVVSDRFGSGQRSTTSKATASPRKEIPSAASFAALGVSQPLLVSLNGMSIKTPTEVQAVCIPPIMAGRDCIGNAKTGSGKTIAFALPILQKLLADPYGIYALVLTPTRELAFQIAEQFAVLGASINVRTAVVVGGMDMMAQALELDNRPHIVIATPGRLVDHLKSTSGGWDLSRVKFLVLDEADRLLTPTFSPELSHIFRVLPKDRQTCLFTATLTPTIDALIDATPRPGKSKPFVHRMSQGIETVSTLKQQYILVPSHVREAYLYHLLCHPPESTLHLRHAPPDTVKTSHPSRKAGRSKKKKSDTKDAEIEQPPPTIIFCARAQTAAYLTLLLKALSIRSTALHSRLTQRERLSSLSLFRASVIPVLISTDVGARGLDIEDVAMVINWDMPNEPEEYTHRVGRTARAGKGGLAISFVTERDEERVLKIETRINTKLEEMTMREEQVLEKLNGVSTAKRLANMELHDSNFGKREEIHKIKNSKIRSTQTGGNS